MTPRARVLIIVLASLIWLGNAVLPKYTDYKSENGIGVAVLGIYGVALGLPELRRKRDKPRADSSRDDDEGGE